MADKSAKPQAIGEARRHARVIQRRAFQDAFANQYEDLFAEEYQRVYEVEYARAFAEGFSKRWEGPAGDGD